MFKYENVAKAIRYNFDLQDKTAKIISQFNSDTNTNAFKMIINDIATSTIIAPQQKQHFQICLKCLENANFSLNQFNSIHIVSLTTKGPKHYVQIDNTNVKTSMEQEVQKKYLYINYNPSYWNRICHPITSSEILLAVIVINCFVFAFFHVNNIPSALMPYLVDHPFKSTFYVIVMGSIYSIIGQLIAGNSIFRSIILNAILTFSNLYASASILKIV